MKIGFFEKHKNLFLTIVMQNIDCLRANVWNPAEGAIHNYYLVPSHRTIDNFSFTYILNK